jgi:hypothetical protein
MKLLSLCDRSFRLWATVFLWTILALPALALATDSTCRDDIRPVDGNPLGYRQRANRCEGLYWSPHADHCARCRGWQAGCQPSLKLFLITRLLATNPDCASSLRAIRERTALL